MTGKPLRIGLSFVFLSLMLMLPHAGAEEAGPLAKEAVALQERTKFNKLKRSTQNIYKLTMRSAVAFKLQTALGYVSTIDLPEEALKVFTGSQELFKIEVYEKQVLVKPLTDEMDARTNLVILTASGRLAFDVMVGSPDSADFVLDFRLPEEDSFLVQNAFDKRVEEKTEELEERYQAKARKLEEKAETLSEEKLKEKIASRVSTITLKQSATEGQIQVNLLSLSQVGDKAYLRFSVLNYSGRVYRPLKVMVGAVTEERRFIKKRREGVVEFPSELSLAEEIESDSYVYGVLAFDYRVLGKNEKPIFRMLEDIGQGQSRIIEIADFPWFP